MTWSSPDRQYSFHAIEDKMKPIPLIVGLIVKDAFQFTWDYRKKIIQASLLSFSSLVLLALIHEYYSSQIGFFLKIFYEIARGIVFTLLAITCHRIVLLGKDSGPKFGILTLSKRELRFFSWYMLIILLSYLMLNTTKMVSLLFISNGNWFFVMQVMTALVWLYLFARLSVLLPATAIDKQKELSWAWNMTKNNGIRMAIISMIIISTIWLIAMICIGAPIYIFFKKGILFNLSFQFFLAIALVVDIVALSFAYKQLTINEKYRHNKKVL